MNKIVSLTCNYVPRQAFALICQFLVDNDVKYVKIEDKEIHKTEAYFAKQKL